MATSHSRTVRRRCRWPAVLPSGLNATEQTAAGVAGERAADRAAGGHVPQPDRVVARCRVASILPSGLNATDSTAPVWPVSGLPIGRPVATSHSRMVSSSLPLASVLPSGLNATRDDRVGVAGQRAARSGWPVATSHSRIVPSSLPLASVLPSGLNATDQTAGVAGQRAARRAAGGHVPQPDRVIGAAVARVLPSGLNATE